MVTASDAISGRLYTSVCLMFLLGMVFCHAAAAQYDSETKKLVGEDHKLRSAALRTLTKAQSQSGARYKLFDLDNKYEIFVNVSEIEDFGHVYGTARLLSRCPVDEKLLKHTKQIVAMHSQETTNNQTLIAALQYLSKHSPDHFSEFFRDLAYEDMDEDLIYAFSGMELMNAKRDQHYQQIIASYLGWTPTPGVFDQDNPFRQSLLSLDRNALTAIFKKMYGNPQRAIPVTMIWLWGEMGATEDATLLDLLLDEYSQRPSPRTAISIGSCMGTLGIDRLLGHSFTEEELREILSHIYGSRWPEVRDKSLEEIKTHWLENWLELRENCKARSVPESG